MQGLPWLPFLAQEAVMMKRIFKFGLICAGIFVLCGIAFALGGGVGPCGGSLPSVAGLFGGMLSATLGAVALVISSPVLLYRKLYAGEGAEG
jgi:hypothetical protein